MPELYSLFFPNDTLFHFPYQSLVFFDFWKTPPTHFYVLSYFHLLISCFLCLILFPLYFLDSFSIFRLNIIFQKDFHDVANIISAQQFLGFCFFLGMQEILLRPFAIRQGHMTSLANGM